MKEPVKFGIILFVFCAISAGLLAFVNGFTSPIIAKAELETTLKSYSLIFGDKADKFDKYDEAKLAALKEKYPEVEDIFVATKGGKTVGYGINYKASGFGGDMTNAIGILTEGDKVAGWRNISNSETKGFGTVIADEPYYSKFEGKSFTKEMAISKDPKAENEILQISGATVTSKAVLKGTNEIVKAYNEVLKNDK